MALGWTVPTPAQWAAARSPPGCDELVNRASHVRRPRMFTGKIGGKPEPGQRSLENRTANDPDGLPIAEALAFATLEYVDLKNAIVQSGYRAAPKTRARGVPRVFDLDQLVAAFVFGQLKMRYVVAGFACQIANDVHRLIKKDHSISRLSAWKVKRRGQQPRVVVAEGAPQPTAIELFRFEIHDIKLKALDGMRERQKQQYAKRNP
jgi:hypothetical protein